MTDVDAIKRIAAEITDGTRRPVHIGPTRALRAVWLALLWARVGGAPAALRWLKGVLDDY